LSKCYDRGSNPQPIPDDAYFISTVAQVRDAIIKRENFSIGFRNIMKTAVKERVLNYHLKIRNYIVPRLYNTTNAGMVFVANFRLMLLIPR